MEMMAAAADIAKHHPYRRDAALAIRAHGGRTAAFAAVRMEDVTGVSGTGVVAQLSVCADGTVVALWAPVESGAPGQMALCPDLDTWTLIHGHGGNTQLHPLSQQQQGEDMKNRHGEIRIEVEQVCPQCGRQLCGWWDPPSGVVDSLLWCADCTDCFAAEDLEDSDDSDSDSDDLNDTDWNEGAADGYAAALGDVAKAVRERFGAQHVRRLYGTLVMDTVLEEFETILKKVGR